MCVKLISFVVSVILARLLDPEHYAIIALISIFYKFVTSGFSKTFVHKENSDEIDYSSDILFFINNFFCTAHLLDNLGQLMHNMFHAI